MELTLFVKCFILHERLGSEYASEHINQKWMQSQTFGTLVSGIYFTWSQCFSRQNHMFQAHYVDIARYFGFLFFLKKSDKYSRIYIWFVAKNKVNLVKKLLIRFNCNKSFFYFKMLQFFSLISFRCSLRRNLKQKCRDSIRYITFVIFSPPTSCWLV